MIYGLLIAIAIVAVTPLLMLAMMRLLRVERPGRPAGTITVASAAFIRAGQTLRIGSGADAEYLRVERVDGSMVTVSGLPQRVWRWQR